MDEILQRIQMMIFFWKYMNTQGKRLDAPYVLFEITPMGFKSKKELKAYLNDEDTRSGAASNYTFIEGANL